METTDGIAKWTLWAFGAGMGSGLLGIGGGMILGPLLLDLGMSPKVSAPITHFAVLFTSSMSVIQFALLGQLLPAHAGWFRRVLRPRARVFHPPTARFQLRIRSRRCLSTDRSDARAFFARPAAA
jgi:hypothetical protein